MSDASPEDEAADRIRTPAIRAKRRAGWPIWPLCPSARLRSGVGMLGGAARETAGLLVPRSFQNSRTYGVMVRQMLDFLVHDVGGVEQQQSATRAAGRR